MLRNVRKFRSRVHFAKIVLGPAIGIILLFCGKDSGESSFDSASVPNGERPKVTVELENYSFNPRNFNLSIGDSVDFTLISMDELHTFTVEGLDIDWSVSSQEPKENSFTFDQPGKYKLVCIIPPHQGMGMIGTVTVR